MKNILLALFFGIIGTVAYKIGYEAVGIFWIVVAANYNFKELQ